MAGLRVVADCTDQPDYDVERVRGIIESTGALVAILPNRGESTNMSSVSAFRRGEPISAASSRSTAAVSAAFSCTIFSCTMKEATYRIYRDRS